MDWFSVSKDDLRECGLRVSSKLQLGNILEQLYPHIDWTKLHQINRFAQQRHLERAIRTLFPVHFFFFFFFF